MVPRTLREGKNKKNMKMCVGNKRFLYENSNENFPLIGSSELQCTNIEQTLKNIENADASIENN